MMNFIEGALRRDKNNHRLFLIRRNTHDQIAQQSHLALRIINLHLSFFYPLSHSFYHFVDKRVVDRALLQIVHVMTCPAVDADEWFRKLAGNR